MTNDEMKSVERWENEGGRVSPSASLFAVQRAEGGL